MEPQASRPTFDAPGRKTGYYDLQRLKGVHHRIAQLAVLGKNAVEIAELVDRTPQMVRYTLDSMLVQQKMEEMIGALDENALNVARTLQETAPLALRELISQLLEENTEKSVKRDLAKDLLDRAHYGKNSSVQVHVGMTPEDLHEIKTAAKQNMKTAQVEEGEGFEILEDDDD